MKKRIVDLIFIVVSAFVLIVLSEYEVLEKYVGFSLIPILMAYFFGQYSERKFKK
jgi:hypothetical protein